MIVDGEIGVLSGVDGADAFVDAELQCGIKSDQLERFFARETTELDGLGGLLIQMRGFLGIIGVDGHEDAAAGH